MPSHEQAEGWFRIGYAELANKLGYRSERTIKILVKKFISLGLLEKIRPLIGGKNTACLRITEKKNSLGYPQRIDKCQRQPTLTLN